MKKSLVICLIACASFVDLIGVDSLALHNRLATAASSFYYPLNVQVYPSKNPDASVTVCFHGYGGDYRSQLTAIGVTDSDRRSILEAIQRGYVIIDCPLKSCEEIVDFRGYHPQLVYLAQVYKQNRLRPIDSINDMQGLSLNVLINFQDPDEAVSNRDDDLFYTKFNAVNKSGKTLMR